MFIDTYFKTVLSGTLIHPHTKAGECALLTAAGCVMFTTPVPSHHPPTHWLVGAAKNANATRISTCHAKVSPRTILMTRDLLMKNVVLTWRSVFPVVYNHIFFWWWRVLTKHNNNVHVYDRAFFVVCALQFVTWRTIRTRPSRRPPVRVFLFRPYLHHHPMPPLSPRAKQTISILGAAHLMCLLAVVTGGCWLVGIYTRLMVVSHVLGHKSCWGGGCAIEGERQRARRAKTSRWKRGNWQLTLLIVLWEAERRIRWTDFNWGVVWCRLGK